jgi:hypothetical protein
MQTLFEQLDCLGPVVKAKFINNLVTLNSKISESFPNWFLEHTDQCTIRGAFMFDKSPEGRVFWEAVDTVFSKLQNLDDLQD